MDLVFFDLGLSTLGIFYTSFDSQDDQPDEVVQHTGGTTAAALLY